MTTEVSGLEALPVALRELFDGDNTGKMVVNLPEE
ncbi:NADPH-dependent curcumin reductase CurA [Bradyrhizobium elkanii]